MNTEIPRYMLKFWFVKDEKTFELGFTVNAPTLLAIPLPGDEIQIPQEVADKAGLTGNCFKVDSRRFDYSNVPPGMACLIYLRLA